MTDAISSMRHRGSESPLDAERPGNPLQDPDQLRRFRVAAGLSLCAVAARTGRSKGYLSELENWEQDRSRKRGASPMLLAQLAEVYGCTVDELMHDPPRRIAS